MSDMDVCIGDQVLLTNQLVGTVEFIGHLHDYNEIDVEEYASDEATTYEIKYGILIDLSTYKKYPSCLDKKRKSKYGKINKVCRIPIELFNIDNMNVYFESVFIDIDEIVYVKRRKHNFRIKMNEQYIIPTEFGSIYGACLTQLKYAGYLCAHKTKTHDNISDYNEYISNNGLLQNYYVGFVVNKQYKNMINWGWGTYNPNKRWCRLYPQDSRRYIHHKFTASLDSIRPQPNDDIVLFINLYELITMLNDTKCVVSNDHNDLYLYQFRRCIAFYFDAIKKLPKLHKFEQLSFKTFLESVLLRYWKCITYKQNIKDINVLIIDYISIYLRDDVLIERSSLITELYECGFIDKLLSPNYGFDKLTIIDNESMRELIYKNEKCLLHPWIEGHVFDTKLWIKTQWNNEDGYRAIIPAFRGKFQGSTNIKDEFKNGDIKYRCGIRPNLLVIIYRFKTITLLLLWKTANNKVIEANKRAFSLALQNVQLRKITNKKHRKGKKSKKMQDENNKEDSEKLPTQRFQVFQFVMDTIFTPMNKYFQHDL